ncbi:hypothetical protein ACHAXS_000563, partial [Conticribra weissflogii]
MKTSTSAVVIVSTATGTATGADTGTDTGTFNHSSDRDHQSTPSLRRWRSRDSSRPLKLHPRRQLGLQVDLPDHFDIPWNGKNLGVPGGDGGDYYFGDGNPDDIGDNFGDDDVTKNDDGGDDQYDDDYNYNDNYNYDNDYDNNYDYDYDYDDAAGSDDGETSPTSKRKQPKFVLPMLSSPEGVVVVANANANANDTDTA